MPGERPVPGPPTIGVEGELDVLRDLLQIERERLTVALRIEAERKIVFPETTVICRDVERLVEKVARLECGELEPGPKRSKRAISIALPVPAEEDPYMVELLQSIGDRD